MNEDASQTQSQTPFDQAPGDSQNSKASFADSLKQNWAMFLSIVLLVASGIITFLALTDSKPEPAKVADTAAATAPEEADSDAAKATNSAIVELTAGAPNPDALTITPGTSVVWRNADNKTLQVVGEAIGSNAVEAGASFTYIFDQPGEYTYKVGANEATVSVRE